MSLAPMMVVALAHAAPLVGQTARYVEPVTFARVAELRDPRLFETSGVAVSRNHSGIAWTHNDSDHEPVLFAIDLRGETVATFRVQRAENRDWEDIALAPCPANPTASCLYIADTGDNLEQRRSVDIYVVREPDPGTTDAGQTELSHQITVRYPNGAHDVEAIAVAPDGEISLVTKGRSGAILRFRIPKSPRRRTSMTVAAPETLDIVLSSPGAMVTGAAFAPDGPTLVIRSYTELHFYQWAEDGSITRLGLPCYLGLREPQGEAVDFLDGDTLLLTSEAALGMPAHISRVRCPRTPSSAR